MSKKYLFCSLLFVLLVVAFLGGCNEINNNLTGNLRGRIYDGATNELIEKNVTVALDGLPVTVSNGEYFFEGLLPGNKELLVKSSGYNNHTVTAKVKAGKTTIKDVYLEPKDLAAGGLAGRIYSHETDQLLLAYVKVSLLGDYTYQLSTEDGSYLFDEVIPGQYRLKVSSAGFRTVYINVTIEESVIGSKDVYMSLSSG